MEHLNRWEEVVPSHLPPSPQTPEDLLLIGASTTLFFAGEDEEAVSLFAPGEGIHVHDFRSFEQLVVSYRERRSLLEHASLSSGVSRSAGPALGGNGGGSGVSSFRIAESLCSLLCSRRNAHDAVRIGPSEVFLDVSVSELLGAALFFHPSTVPEGQHLSLTVPIALGWVARAHLALALGMNGIGVRRINSTAAALAAALLETAKGRGLLVKHEGQVRLLIVEASCDYIGAAVVQVEMVVSNLPLSPSLCGSLPPLPHPPPTPPPAPFHDDSTCVSFATGAKKGKKKKNQRDKPCRSPDDNQDSTLQEKLPEMQLSSISSTPLIRVESMCGSATLTDLPHSDRLQGCIRAALERAGSCTAIDAVVLWLGDADHGDEAINGEKSSAAGKESALREIVEAELLLGGGLRVDGSWLRLSRHAVEVGSTALASSRVYECECRKIGLRFIEKKFDGFISHVVWLMGLRAIHDVIIRVRSVGSPPGSFGVYHQPSQCAGRQPLLMGTMKVPAHTRCDLELQVVEDRSDGSTEDDSVGVILGVAWPEEEATSEAELRFNAQGLLSFHATFHSPPDVAHTSPLVEKRRKRRSSPTRKQQKQEEEVEKKLLPSEWILAVAALALFFTLLALSPRQTAEVLIPPVLDEVESRPSVDLGSMLHNLKVRFANSLVGKKNL